MHIGERYYAMFLIGLDVTPSVLVLLASSYNIAKLNCIW
ncbi:MAG: hypothetical protein BAJALOKI1v1_2410004 [Promethearchaeota archaeon]|nr:MAG: hypothetical protein BAJALOKI1v1_2410004 [Candidatus Lokiarchaeota archaeon]